MVKDETLLLAGLGIAGVFLLAKPIRDTASQVGGGLGTAVGGLGSGISQAGQGLGSGISDIGTGIGGGVKDIGESLGNFAQESSKSLIKTQKYGADLVGEIITSSTDNVKNFQGLLDKGFMASGQSFDAVKDDVSSIYAEGKNVTRQVYDFVKNNPFSILSISNKIKEKSLKSDQNYTPTPQQNYTPTPSRSSRGSSSSRKLTTSKNRGVTITKAANRQAMSPAKNAKVSPFTGKLYV